MRTLQCIVAEWEVVRARLFHTRLGVWLLLLSVLLVWASRDDATLSRLAIRTGLLGGVLCVAFSAGADLDRLALRTTLGHPTTPVALAAGRWLAATVAASLPVAGAMLATGILHGAPARVVVNAGLLGILAAAAMAGVALPAVLLGGNTMAAVLFLYLLLVGLTSEPAWPARVARAAAYAGGAAAAGVLAASAWLARTR